MRFQSVNEKITGEYIKELLPNHNIQYYFKLDETIKIKNEVIRSFLYIDYAIVLPDMPILVEYNGIQHYEPVEIFGGQDAFRKQCLRDEWLRSYCKHKSIHLIEVDGRKYEKEDIKQFLEISFRKIDSISLFND